MIAKQPQPFLSSFLIACLVAIILIPAAFLKWLYPPGRDPVFYMVIGGMEAFLALAVLVYWKTWRIWVLLALIVSVWMGFSFYVTLFGLPCSCMGGALQLPRGMSLSLNGFMLLGACKALHQHPAHLLTFKRLAWFFILFFILGLNLAVFYYNYQT
jgi:hypothetical protein